MREMPLNQIIKLGTRSSKLALIQAEEIKKLIVKNTSIKEDQIEIVPITTSGDKIQDKSLAEIGGKGLFIKELEEALILEKIDIAIHSAKDVPPIIHQNTELAAFNKRRDARDYFISPKYNSIDELPKSAKVGTSSARRKSVLLGLRPDLQIVNFRGNIDTRLKKIDENQVDATILAVCGLQRIGKKIDEKKIIDTKTMLPAVGQGCLALQIRKNDKKNLQILQKINHKPSQICVKTERAFLRDLNASCKSPVAVYAKIESEKLILETAIFDFDGAKSFATKQEVEIGNFDLEKDVELVLEKGFKLANLAFEKTKKEAFDLLKRII